MCIHEGCNKKSIYSNPCETKALYCSEHRENGMVNMKHKRCIHEGCKTISIYNKEGLKKPLYCSKHKEYGM